MGQINFDFTNQNFIVTGASSGMGKAIACELAMSGANVLAVARREEPLLAMTAQHPGIVPGVADVADTITLQSLIDVFRDKYGKFHGLVHAAGFCEYSVLRGYAEDQALSMMETSFWAGIRLVQLLHRKAYTWDGASFVLFSSVASHSGKRGLFAYSAAKAAVSNAVRSLSGELAKRHLRINAICPGRVLTPLTENMEEPEYASRYVLGEGQPRDVSGAALFLLSDRASWITGTDLVVDGGFLAN